MRYMMILLALLFASTADAASTGVRITGGGLGTASSPPFVGSSCTDGSDCLCDVVSTSNPLLYCEDFESLDYYENTSADWAAASDGNRGALSRWELLHFHGDGTMFRNTDPTPLVGNACTAGSQCVGTREYCNAAQGAIVGVGVDCWGSGNGANNSAAAADIQRSGDFDDEVAGLTLSGGIGATSDVGDGNAHLAYRIAPGSTAGTFGNGYLKSGGGGTVSDNDPFTELGVTFAVAYSPNIFTETDTVLNAPWKHDEYYESDPAFGEAWILGHTQGSHFDSHFPFHPYMLAIGTCGTAIASAVAEVGTVDCDSSAMRMTSSGSFYDQATHWPPGEFKCIQGHIVGMGTTDMDIEIKFEGSTVIRITGINGTAMDNQAYSAYLINAYSNLNEDGDGTSNDTDETQFRYEDDMLIVNGPPEPCSAIGR